MNEAMHRFDRKMDAHRLVMRAASIVAIALGVWIVLLLMSAGIQDVRLNG